MEFAEFALACLFALMAWSAARQNTLADRRYWARDAERNRILDPAPRLPDYSVMGLGATASFVHFTGTDSGHSHALIHPVWLQGQ